MKVELWPIGQVKPYEHNPRLNDAAVDAVARSIAAYGFRQPIVVDMDGVVVCGHTRWKAALKLGLEQVPVHVAEGLTDSQIKAYRIADNQTATLATWDLEKLPTELEELRALDVDLSLLGFDQDELARILDPGVKDGLCDPDDVPEPPDAAITRQGDLWVLGEHRLLCGDSASASDVNRLLAVDVQNGDSTKSSNDNGDILPVHMVNTDPPYNVKVEPRSNNAIARSFVVRRARPDAPPIVRPAPRREEAQ